MARAIAECKCKTCGADFKIVQTCNNRKSADSFENYASSNYDECTECYKKRMAEIRKAEEAKALEIASGYNLPELSGSDKQIAWANKIRAQFIVYAKNIDNNPIIANTIIEYITGKYTAAASWIDAGKFNSDGGYLKLAYDNLENRAAIKSLLKEKLSRPKKEEQV